MTNFFIRKSTSTILFYSVLGMLIALASLHLFVGYADNGDFPRSVAFIFEKPQGFSAMWPSPDTEEWKLRFYAQWYDKWIFFADWPVTVDMHTYSSYKIYLLSQAALTTLLFSDVKIYSVIAGSIFSRLIFMSTFFILFYQVRKNVPSLIFWLFVILTSAVLLDVNFTAYLNSFYEEQMAIIFLPVMALLFYKYYQKPSIIVGFFLLTCTVVIALAKIAFFYLPLLVAPFLFHFFRERIGAFKFILIIAVCQIITFLPVPFGKTTPVNAYHAVYVGALDSIEKDKAQSITMIGEKPVFHECIGFSAFTEEGKDCPQKVNASYSDVLKIILAHPSVGYKMIKRVFSQGNSIKIDYLGKSISGVPDFSNVRLFNLTAMVFPYWFNRFVLGMTFIALTILYFMRGRNSESITGMLKIGLFFALFGFSQYCVTLADGFVDYIKHLTIGNYSLALSVAFFVSGFLLLILFKDQNDDQTLSKRLSHE